ncbi:helix-turn-helix domain-containing protein [Turicimonas muris]|uniref:helix-turn-helix domain-containing protein n=1 Tax=Turicimonas muris TaxID=1796652 RepID=UPI00248BA2FB|nr:helix-turn-helix transcriptional regulator [Turicimonas muris]
MSTLPERIDFLLKLRGINQAQLADLIGIKKSAITNLKNGRSKSFSAENALTIAKKLNINPYWLVFGEGDPEPKEPSSEASTILKRLPSNKQEFATQLLKNLEELSA